MTLLELSERASRLVTSGLPFAPWVFLVQQRNGARERGTRGLRG
jgi:hypothetical protein